LITEIFNSFVVAVISEFMMNWMEKDEEYTLIKTAILSLTKNISRNFETN